MLHRASVALAAELRKTPNSFGRGRPERGCQLHSIQSNNARCERQRATALPRSEMKWLRVLSFLVDPIKEAHHHGQAECRLLLTDHSCASRIAAQLATFITWALLKAGRKLGYAVREVDKLALWWLSKATAASIALLALFFELDAANDCAAVVTERW